MKFIEFTKTTLKIGKAKQKIDMQIFLCSLHTCNSVNLMRPMPHAPGISDTAQHTQRRTDLRLVNSTLFTSTPIARVHIGIYIVNKFTKPYHGKIAMHFVFKKKISRRSL